MKQATARKRARQRWFVAGAVLLMAVVLAGLDLAAHLSPPGYHLTLWGQALASLPVALVVAYIAARVFTWFSVALEEKEVAWAAAVSRVEYLEARNAILHALATTTDLTVAFAALSEQIGHIVPCDRVALSLLTENGEELHAYMGQPATGDRGATVRPDLLFRRAGTLMDEVIRSGQPRIVADISAIAPDHLDANVVWTGGYGSGLICPLVVEGKPLGTLNLAARQKNAFTDVHLRAVRPVADTIALACGTQQLARRLARTQLAHAIADTAFAMANEINGAMQTIVGHCELVEREHSGDVTLQRDLATIIRNAHRVINALERLRALVTTQALPPGDRAEPDAASHPAAGGIL